MKSLTYIVKTTRRCNLRCSYCHDWRDSGARSIVPADVAALASLAAIEDFDRVQWIWHGGEPLLLGRDWFERALAVQLCASQHGVQSSNSLQTNGTLLDSEWCQFFRKYGFSVGVSIDGPPALHDWQRPSIKGAGSFAEVKRGIELLKAYDVSFGTLLVVTREIIKLGPDAIYGFLVDLGIPSIGFLPQRPDPHGLTKVRAPATDSHFLARQDFQRFMQGILRRWWDDNGKGPFVRELESLLQSIVGGRPSLCTQQGGCVGKYFSVEPTGEIFHCDRFSPDERYGVGSIQDGTASLSTGRIEKIRDGAARGEDTFRKSCRWSAICNGGCPHDREYDPRPEGDAGCCGLDSLIADMVERVNEVLPGDRMLWFAGHRHHAELIAWQ